MLRFLPVMVLLASGTMVRAGAIVWIAGIGNWNTPGNWSGGDVPDMLGDVAVIGLSSAVVTLDVSPTIDGVAITDAAARLNLGGRTLSVLPQGIDTTGLLVANTGTNIISGNISNTGAGVGRGIEITGGAGLVLSSPIITNSGRIEINPSNANASTFLRADVDTMLMGSGTMRLNSPANRASLNTLDPAVITQASTHSIRGLGQVPAAIINNGLISADVSGQVLTLQTAAKVNNGTLSATNSGVLDIFSITVDQGPTGVILADAGTVRATTTTINGGSTSTLNNGVIQFVGGASILNSVTNAGDLDQLGGTAVSVTGDGLTNNGRYDINPANLVAQTTLQFVDSGALDGTGEVVMRSPANRAILATGAGATISHSASHTIRGMGQLNASLINDGLVSADVNGQALVLQTNAKTNNSLFEAVNGSFLDISSIEVTQSPDAMIVADGGTVRLSISTINGGTLATGMGGAVQVVAGSNTLNSVTTSGDLDQFGGTNVIVTGDGLTNHGRLDVNPASLVAQTTLQFNHSGDLEGSGEVVLGSPANRAILASGAGVTITHAATHRVRGMGQINALLINNGVLTADVNGQALVLQINGKTNNNLIEAINGSFLDITSIMVAQNAGALISADGSTVRLSNATISGGSISSVAGGVFVNTAGTSTLTSVLSNAEVTVNSGTVVLVNGTGLTNNGDITINPTNAAAITELRFDTTSDLLGSGRIIMGSVNNRSRVATGAGATLTHTALHTIEGAGEIAATLVNNGLVEANNPGDALLLITNPKTNNTTMRAVGGAFLDVNSIVLTQGAGAELLADASTIRFNSATIVGGRVRTINGGSASLATGATTLTGITFEGVMSQTGGIQTNINGSGIVNNGTITINPAVTNAITPFHFTQSGTLAGSGTLRLGAPTNRSSLSGAAGVTITNGPSHTIAGLGQLTAPLVLNDGFIAPGLSTGSIQVQSVLTLRNSSVLEIELGGTGAGAFDSVVGTGTINLGGTLRVSFTNGHVPIGSETYAIITTTNHPARFAAFDLPALTPPLEWRVEYLTSAVRLNVSPFCFGDATFDEVVNFADVTAVLSNFGADYSPAPGTGPGDSNRDGIVNFADVTNTLSNFNANCP